LASVTDKTSGHRGVAKFNDTVEKLLFGDTDARSAILLKHHGSNIKRLLDRAQLKKSPFGPEKLAD
jgi:hypothetical protein